MQRSYGCGRRAGRSGIGGAAEQLSGTAFPEGSSKEYRSPGLWPRIRRLLLCDEPTGALDYNTGKAILKLLQDTCRNKGMTVILITHNSAIAPMADRVIKIKNGKVSDIIENKYPVSVETIEW